MIRSATLKITHVPSGPNRGRSTAEGASIRSLCTLAAFVKSPLRLESAVVAPREKRGLNSILTSLESLDELLRTARLSPNERA